MLYEIDSKNVNMSTISMKDNHKIQLTNGSAVCDVKFSHKGTLIASCSADKHMCVIDSQGFMKICEKEFESGVSCLCWMKNDQYLLIGDRAGTLHVWNMVQGLIQYQASLHSGKMNVNCYEMNTLNRFYHLQIRYIVLLLGIMKRSLAVVKMIISIVLKSGNSLNYNPF